MATEDEDDAEALPHFKRLLEKAGSEWLDKLRPLNPIVSSPKGEGSNPITDFFREQVADLKTALKQSTDQMEAMRDLLTPEQLTQLRSRNSAGPSGDGKKAISGPPNNEPKPDGGNSNGGESSPAAPAAKPRKKWL